MFSDNIIERHNALADLFNLNSINVYFLGVVILILICWKLKEIF